VLLYELVAGRPPYDSDVIPDLMRRHMEGNPQRPLGLAEPIWDLILQCMALKPRHRPPANELVVSLSDAARKCAGTAALPRRAGIADLQSADEQDPVSIVPLPRLPRLAAGAGSDPGRAREDYRNAAPRNPRNWDDDTDPRSRDRGAGDPRGADGGGPGPRPGDGAEPSRGRVPKNRGNAAPSWRWARPGATLIAGAMLASAVAATAWQFGRSTDRPLDAATGPQVIAEPSAARVPYRGTAGPWIARRGVAAQSSARSQARAPGGTAVARSATAAPVPPGNPALSATPSRSPRPEAKPYGPLQCTESLAFDLGSKTPLMTRPCRMLGRDVQFQASLTGPGGGTGSITVSVQDAGTGRTVAGPKTCGDLAFGGRAATQACGPVGAKPARGKKYAVVMSFRYQRNGRLMAGNAKGSAFAW
jgi:hypothetical protein